MPRLDIETRRAQLIQAAVAIALRDGLDNTTVRRIATEAGVSLGTVHYCFDSKKALLEAMVESIATRDIEAASLPLPDDVSPVDAIRAAFRYYWSISGAQADRQRLVYELVADGLAAMPRSMALNDTTLKGIDGDVLHLEGHDGAAYAVRPRIVVNVSGPWIDTADAAL